MNNIKFIIVFIALIFKSVVGVSALSDTTSLDSLGLDPGDEIVATLDRATRVPFLESHRFDTSRTSLNIYGFAADSVPTYDSAYYAHFLS